MILINKDNSVQDLVLTLTELTTIINPVYLLVLRNEFTNNSTRYILQNNISPNLNRYDNFQLDTSLFNDLETGDYGYTIYQSDSINYDETTLGNYVETGKAKVTATNEQAIAITYNSAIAETITYKG
jgi:hypothetical protein